MNYDKRRSHKWLLKAIPIINLSGNLFAMSMTFVYFAVIEPGLTHGTDAEFFWDRLTFFLVVMVIIWAIAFSINIRSFLRVVRDFRNVSEYDAETVLNDSELKSLRELAGKLMNVPVRFAGMNLLGWSLAAVIYVVLPHVWPAIYPWTVVTSHKIFFGLLFAGTFNALSIYLVMELWIRVTIRKVLPEAALLSVPPSLRIRVLPKMLAVSLLIGVFPVSLISHVTLNQIRAIHAERQSIIVFMDQMPELIGFLLSLSVLGAIVLSVLLAKSISEPLRAAGVSMERIETGAKNVTVPVVSNDEIGVMGEGFNRMMEGLRERDAIRETFGRYLSKEIVNEILKSPGGIDLQGEQREITILVSDLRGFTKMTECNDPQVVLKTLNRYLERMTDIILDHNGTIDEFTGDGILVFFGAPQPMPDHQIQAVRCALEMQEAMKSLNEENSGLELPQLEMGIAINTGELIVGNIGSEKRRKYGAIGSPINVAYRTESLAPAKHILITPTVYETMGDYLRIGETREVALKGIEQPVTLYQVAGISSSPIPPIK